MQLVDLQVTKSDFDAVEWLAIIENCEKQSCSSYQTAFFEKANEVAETDNVAQSVYLLLAHVCSLHLNTQSSEEPLQPFITWHDVRSAIPSDFTDNQLNVLAEIIPDITDSELCSRIADLICLRKGDFKIALVAVDKYIEASTTAYNQHPMAGLERLERGLQIALRLGRNNQSLSKIVSYIDKKFDEKKSEDYVIAWHLSELLLSSKTGDEQKYIEELHEIGELAEKNQNWYLANKIWQSLAMWQKRASNESAAKNSYVKAAEVDVKQAELGAEEGNFLAATAHMQNAIEAYRRIGGEDAISRVTILHQQLLEYQKLALDNMKYIEVEASPDVNNALNQIRENAQNRVKGLSLYDALLTFASLTPPPRLEELKSAVEKSMQEHVFSHLVQSRIIDAEGKTKGLRNFNSSLTPEDQTMRIEMLRQAITSRSFLTAILIHPALEQIRLEHSPSLNYWKHLVTNHPLVPPEREKIFAKGLRAGFEGDYLVASHLLIPQIENSLRYLLMQNGVITSGLDKDLIQQDYTLGKLLYMEELKQILGDDLVFDLQGLLVESVGSNLRNLLSHGLLNHHELSEQPFIYLWWLIIHLWALPILLYQDDIFEQDVSNSENLEEE